MSDHIQGPSVESILHAGIAELTVLPEKDFTRNDSNRTGPIYIATPSVDVLSALSPYNQKNYGYGINNRPIGPLSGNTKEGLLGPIPIDGERPPIAGNRMYCLQPVITRAVNAEDVKNRISEFSFLELFQLMYVYRYNASFYFISSKPTSTGDKVAYGRRFSDIVFEEMRKSEKVEIIDYSGEEPLYDVISTELLVRSALERRKEQSTEASVDNDANIFDKLMWILSERYYAIPLDKLIQSSWSILSPEMIDTTLDALAARGIVDDEAHEAVFNWLVFINKAGMITNISTTATRLRIPPFSESGISEKAIPLVSLAIEDLFTNISSYIPMKMHYPIHDFEDDFKILIKRVADSIKSMNIYRNSSYLEEILQSMISKFNYQLALFFEDGEQLDKRTTLQKYVQERSRKRGKGNMALNVPTRQKGFNNTKSGGVFSGVTSASPKRDD